MSKKLMALLPYELFPLRIQLCWSLFAQLTHSHKIPTGVRKVTVFLNGRTESVGFKQKVIARAKKKKKAFKMKFNVFLN